MKEKHCFYVEIEADWMLATECHDNPDGRQDFIIDSLYYTLGRAGVNTSDPRCAWVKVKEIPSPESMSRELGLISGQLQRIAEWLKL